MKSPMTHDKAFADLDALAFDLLDGPERDAIIAHVESCDECRAELDRRRAMVADLAFAAPLSSDTATGGRARIRERLLARAAAERPQVLSAPVQTSGTPSRSKHANGRKSSPILLPTQGVPSHVRSRLRRSSPFLAAAASILFVATLGVLGLSIRDRKEIQDALDAQKLASIAASRAADSLNAILAGLTGRDVTMMTLTSNEAHAPYARMFWDRARNRWTLIAHNMPELKAGRTYQLWLVTANAKISAGTFQPKNGEAIIQATYALTDPLNAIAVTEEPAGGVPQPTGALVIAATTETR